MMNEKVKTKNIKHFNTILYDSKNTILRILKLCTCKIKYFYFENWTSFELDIITGNK